jgi:large subunit ribosomal protein L17
MRHRKGGRKLSMDTSARKAMFRNMVTSLMLHGRIRTTAARAKELRRFAEKVISLAKRAPSAAALGAMDGEGVSDARASRVHAIRRARRWVNNADALDLVFGEYRERFETRAGGYTRIVKAGYRPGDNAPMAYIELVGTSPRADVGAVEAAVEE